MGQPVFELRRVLVFTASGTFRGARGTVQKDEGSRTLVLVEGESFPMYFTRWELVELDPPHHAGAE